MRTALHFKREREREKEFGILRCFGDVLLYMIYEGEGADDSLYFDNLYGDMHCWLGIPRGHTLDTLQMLSEWTPSVRSE